MIQYKDINSQLDALKIKEVEKKFYNRLEVSSNIIPKVTPFKGINIDMTYIKENKILFIKFMDTTEDLFNLLEEELIEVMNEEYEHLKINMEQKYPNISYNYVFIMPNVEVSNTYGFNEFVGDNIIDKLKFESILKYDVFLDTYLKNKNDEISLNLFMLNICPEYYTLNGRINLNNKMKKISFYNEEYKYTATMLEDEQIRNIISINYGSTLYKGGAGTGKTAIMLSKAIKLGRVYPHHKFLILTNSKQESNELREKLNLFHNENNNIQVHTLNSFILKLAKKYDLIVDYNMLKNDYEKAFDNLIKQAKNIIKNKSMFKGIFIDEVESFKKDDLEFISEFLYKNKYIFNLFYCPSLNITNKLNIFKDNLESLEIEDVIEVNKNYRQSMEIVNFINEFVENSNDYINSIRNLNKELFYKTKGIREEDRSVSIIKISDLEEQVNSIIWEINYLVNSKGLSYSDICIIYPYNKKKLKNGNVIYFQYILKKALDEVKIPYVAADDSLTNITIKNGVTISNIYTASNLEYKAVILSELEMLYNHKIGDITQDYQVNDFVGDLNKIYLAINRACDYLSIITTFNEESSDIIKLLMISK